MLKTYLYEIFKERRKEINLARVRILELSQEFALWKRIKIG